MILSPPLVKFSSFLTYLYFYLQSARDLSFREKKKKRKEK